MTYTRTTYTRDQILAEVLELLNSVVQDWEFEGPVGAGTRLFADLAFESLDLVILGAKVQEHFGQTLPFPQLFAEIGQREVRDLTIGEWVDFIDRHIRQPVAAVSRTADRPEGA
jgi:acyl carrier protein